ncbi:glycoside hydrolase family 76 protein [Isoptericola cucumis]|uniref:Glycoside hydrolase n=1 Tax=Isoptericola cucumis TaxID=1776856 RepID=A0ABQ2B8D7_9MICO|nr:glycoside hydrolase family 76 protein [Isoptericola cucumis]GGI10467.1 glycoside hydrolase [Isoptericola cucumis]
MTTTLPGARGVLTWADRADVAQHSLDLLYGAPEPQLLHNAHPGTDDTTFNYWWLAHVVDCRLDAYGRTGDPAWLDAARTTAANVRGRNDGSLFNDYFDDMLWYALALLRLADATPDDVERAAVEGDVLALWEHVVDHGWNDHHGASLSWRKQQPSYKNTPANGPLVILGARLGRRTGEPRYLERAAEALAWLEAHLVGPDGFVEDGLGREGGDAVDTHWRFTYNQGLYIGACVEMYRSTGERDWLDRAERTAVTSVRELATGGVFRREGELVDDDVPDTAGGDVGLFKGVWYRYAAQLLDERPVPEVADLVRSSTDALWAHGLVPFDDVARPDGATRTAADVLRGAGVVLRPGDDWARPAPTQVGYSTVLSAIMALEVRALLD